MSEPTSEVKVTVGLGDRAYDIHAGAGLLARAGELLRPMAKGTVPVVTDENVARLHLRPLLDALGKAGIAARPVVMAPGEVSKSFAGLEKLSGALLDMEVDRKGLIVALGGGVIGDLTGFAAGVLKRGVAFAQIPTTLLAQVDSSVGGKTAINAQQGKNLIGLFHQPRIVIADTTLLATLPRRELLAGYAEVVKYGALGDQVFFEWLELNGRAALDGDQDLMVKAVAHSCRMKAEIVARDERETGDRALLNLGHTFGHALEAATGFSNRLVHGEGVAIGMALAFQLSVKLGLCPGQDAQRFIRHLKAVGLPSSIADIPGPRASADELAGHMAHDKKVTDGKLTFILLRGLGQAFVTRDVPISAVKEVLAA
ncbi:MAG TPA: 3-dehydroquinate synthase [Rhizomicrobium sp.]|jgi:3-dehydroquinate synthase|nr:3-dehydroquinate synthase [Rhizomicrobium sp.]